MKTIDIYASRLPEGEHRTSLPMGLCRADFVYGMHGKPYCRDDRIYFNISHSGVYQVCAVGAVEVGIDIQLMDNRDLHKVAPKLFAPQEYLCWQEQINQREVFYREWVRREAYLKWTGEGITRDLRALPMDGFETEIQIDDSYICILWTGEPVTIKIIREGTI